ncbi:MAG: hypothetical protein AB1540_07955 [Bdellovibrionota bacterium]
MRNIMMAAHGKQRQWLIRKAEHGAASNLYTLLGPYWTDQIKSMIEQGMLEADDELCAEQGYWFALHEVTEVKNHFKLDSVILRRFMKEEDDEATQPEILLDEPSEGVDPDSTGLIRLPSQTAAKQNPGTGNSLTTEGSSQSPLLTSQELAQRFRRVSHAESLGYFNACRVSQSAIKLERSRFWSIIFVACVVLASLGVLWVLRTLKP